MLYENYQSPWLDDELNILKAVQRLLRHEPIEVLTASRAREALAVVVEAISEMEERDEISDLLAYARAHHLQKVSRLLERAPPARTFRVEEETGVRCRLGRELEPSSYRDQKGRKIQPSPNDSPDTHPLFQDRTYGGAGLDVHIGNTGGDRLIDWAEQAENVALWWQDECWFSRFAQPNAHDWGELDLIERPIPPKEKAKALACYGAVRHGTDQMELAFCPGQPNSDFILAFLPQIIAATAAAQRPPAVLAVKRP